MAAGAWNIHVKFKRVMADGTLDLDNGAHVLRLSLYQDTANLSAGAISMLSVIGSVSDEVLSAAGYVRSGKVMNADWTVGGSAGEMRYSGSAVFWSANGGTIASIQYGVLWFSGASANARYILAHSTLSTVGFDLTDTNRITITPSANGIFELN